MRRTALLWFLAAVAGVLLVAGITAAASSLSTQTIGLSSEPLSAGEQLAPPDGETAADERPTRERDDRRDGRRDGDDRGGGDATDRTAPADETTGTGGGVDEAPEVAEDSSGPGSGGDLADSSGPGGGEDSGRGRGRGRGRGGGDDD